MSAQLEDWSHQQQQDEESRRYEIEKVLRDYVKGFTSEEGLKILCREVGIKPSELADKPKEAKWR